MALIKASASKVAVVYICDKNYHDLTAVSIMSLARVTTFPLHIFFFQDAYLQDLDPRVVELVESHGHEVEVRPAPQLSGDFSERNRAARQYISDTTLLKPTAIDSLVTDFDYVVYIDSDVLIFEDLNIEDVLGFEELCAGCIDFPMVSGYEDPNFSENCEKHGRSPNYINAGFYIVNSSRWREIDFIKRYTDAVNSHNANCEYLSNCVLRDQCPFNMAIDGDVFLLPISYNVQRWAIYTKEWHAAKARHYTGGRKFLEPSIVKTDRREFSLMNRLAKESGLELRASKSYDQGILYAANRIRRSSDLHERKTALAEMAMIGR